MAPNSDIKFKIENNILKGEEVPLNHPYYSLGHCLLTQFEKFPDFVGLHDADTDEKYTFNTMKDLTVRCALWITKQGIKSGDLITICTHNHINNFIPFFATLCTEATMNAWYHDMTLATTKFFMSLIKPKIIFTSEYCLKTIVEAGNSTKVKPKIITFEKVPGFECIHDIMNQQTEQEVKNFQATKCSLDQTALVMFSSGTTGMPKGVELTHRVSLSGISVLRPGIVKSEISTKLFYSSLYWMTGIMFRILSIMKPSTIIVHKEYDPDETCKVIEKYKVNWLFLSTSMFHQLHSSGVVSKYNLSSLAQILFGGAKANFQAFEDMRRALPHTSILNGYGTTEIGGVGTFPNVSNPKSIGVLGANVQLKIIDDSGRILGPNNIGEMCFKSPYLMKGYFKNPEETKATIDEEGWVHSGDLAYFDNSGYIYYVDRKKEIMKVRGHQVSPTEIEDFLKQHPDIIECAVIGVPHIIDNDHPMAFVIKKPLSKITKDDIIAFSAELGEIKKLRAGVQFLDKLPHTPSVKIDRKRLREMAKSILNNGEYNFS